MKPTIDSAGRVVIPKEIRRQAGLTAGTELEIRCRNGVIEIEPAAAEVRLEPEGPFLVAVYVGDAQRLTAEDVERTRQSIIEEREHGLLD